MTEDKDQEGPEESAFDKFVRDEQGRFAKQDQVEPAPVEAAPEPQAEQPPAPPQSASPPPAPTPPAEQAMPQDAAGIMKALLDERDKRQARDRELEETRRKLQEYEAKQQQQPEIDPLTDPDGWKQSVVAQMERQVENRMFAQSEYFAAQQHGAETVQAAMQWLGNELQRDPSVWSKIKDNPHPADFVVNLHKRSLGLAKLGDKDPEDFAREWAERNGYVLQQAQPGAPVAAAPSPQPPKAPLPRPSIASAPAAAPVAAQEHAFSEAEVFKGIFGKR